MVWQTKRDAGFELLGKLKVISDGAKKKSADPGVIIPPEDFNNPQPSQTARREWTRMSEDYRRLAKEPLLLALLAETEEGERRVYYFARRAQVDGIERFFTHTMSPIGELASYEPGDEYTLPNGEVIKVISKFVITPKYETEKWDSRPTQIFWNDVPPKSYISLLEYLSAEQAHLVGWDVLGGELEPSEGLARDALRGTGLRDQAILDKVQDEIFRLPLSSQLMISGPPGSGKTTTLIRRMAQKNEVSFLTQEEQAVVQRVSDHGRSHAESWIMFTPTELLEGYLSEAFNREGIPAPKDRIWTWSKFSVDFGREEARLLQKSNNRSGFKLDDKARHLDPKVHAAPADWIQRFDEWLSEEHLKELMVANDKLQVSKQPKINKLSKKIGQHLTDGSSTNLFSIFEDLAPYSENLGQWRKSVSEKWRDLMDRRIDRFGRLDAQNIQKLDALVREIERITNVAANEEAELDDDDDLEFEKRPTTQSRKDRVFAVVRQALNARAREKYRKRKPSRKYADMLDFIGDEVLDETQLVELGCDLEVLSGASRINRASTIFFSSMASRYRIFRSVEPNWYGTTDIGREKIDQDEFDGLILTKLKAVRALLPRVDTEKQFWAALRPFEEKLRNQVYVDEATDFSEMQLAAMYHLTHPKIRSFFMSGDFDQRLTESGIKDAKALQRAIPGIATREVEVGYRQSKKLMNFVEQMRCRWLGSEPNSVPPKFGQYEGYEPAMFEAEGDLDAQARWIADRIHEVDLKHERLPSIAIFVPLPEDVKPLVSRLEGLLDSIPISAHEEAGNLGRDEEVRVFPIHHVKGLEFEAAFFVGIDQLQNDVPDLFHRFLYVGSTRAATFLGFASNNRMPPEIMDMRDMFVPGWGV